MSNSNLSIKNNDDVNEIILVKRLAPSELYDIPQDMLTSWGQHVATLSAILDGSVSIFVSGTEITDKNQAINHLKGSQPLDAATGGLKSSPKYSPDGWLQQIFEAEFETSKLNSIHEKDWENNDIGWASLKFFDSAGNELTDQATIDTDCVTTYFDWMPNIDYMIKSGFVAQLSDPNDDLYVWVLGPVLDDIYGGVMNVFAEGGINMNFVDTKTYVGLDGVSGSILYKDKIVDSQGTETNLPVGSGTNRLRFVVRHSAGKKHRLQAIFNIFK